MEGKHSHHCTIPVPIPASRVSFEANRTSGNRTAIKWIFKIRHLPSHIPFLQLTAAPSICSIPSPQPDAPLNLSRDTWQDGDQSDQESGLSPKNMATSLRWHPGRKLVSSISWYALIFYSVVTVSLFLGLCLAMMARRTTSKLRRLEVCLTEVSWCFQTFSLFSRYCSSVTRLETFLELSCMSVESVKSSTLSFETKICLACFLSCLHVSDVCGKGCDIKNILFWKTVACELYNNSCYYAV